MSTQIMIEAARESDLPSIKRLLSELLQAMTTNDGFDIEQSIENCRELMKDPANHTLVARDSDHIQGFINFTTRRTIMHPGPSGLIDELVVSRERRGSGIGRRLVQAAIEKCRALGSTEVEVSTEKSNLSARRFYKTCGFEEDAVLLEIHF